MVHLPQKNNGHLGRYTGSVMGFAVLGFRHVVVRFEYPGSRRLLQKYPPEHVDEINHY